MIHRVYLGIGSNIEAQRHIGCGLDELALLGLTEVSSVYRSAAVGFDGAPFLNCVAAIETGLSVPDLVRSIREIEFRYGRTEDCDKFSSRCLDIDMLIYDDFAGTIDGISLPRPEITINAYVLCPFAEVAGQLQIPGQRETLGRLWSAYDLASQPLTRVDYVWRGKALPLTASALRRQRAAAID